MSSAKTQTSRRNHTELMLSIGGVTGHLRIEGLPRALATDLARRYAAFALPCSPAIEPTFSLRVGLRPRPSTAAIPDAPPRLATSNDRVEIERLDLRAVLTRGKGSAVFHGTAHCQATHVALESLLRLLWSVFLPRAGGALFHACGFRHDGRGVLAPGPSGAGKTTLARKLPNPHQVLSDEVVAVHRDGQGAWRISGTPFFGELQRVGGSMQSWPLAGIAFLEKRGELGSRTLDSGEAVLRALACLLCFETDLETVQRNFALVVALCAEVPTFACGSRADTPFADLMAEIGPRLRGVAGPEPAPHNTRELVSALRAELARHGSYAFAPTGTSMRPWLRTGDALFIEPVVEAELRSGDVVLYWRAGRSAEQDALICHRVVRRVATDRGVDIYAKGDALEQIERFENGKEAEVIGRVRGISRGGQSWAVPGAMGNLALLLGSFLLVPFLKARARR